jgi:hypothetical protein
MTNTHRIWHRTPAAAQKVVDPLIFSSFGNKHKKARKEERSQ